MLPTCESIEGHRRVPGCAVAQRPDVEHFEDPDQVPVSFNPFYT